MKIFTLWNNAYGITQRFKPNVFMFKILIRFPDETVPTSSTMRIHPGGVSSSSQLNWKLKLLIKNIYFEFRNKMYSIPRH